MSQPSNAREFRRQLDDVLRQRNPQALRDFLVAAGQWDEANVPADLDRAMWLMIAASSALSNLHGDAQRWLVEHGFAQEAQAILGHGGSGQQQTRSQARTGNATSRRQGARRSGSDPRRSGQSGERRAAPPTTLRPGNGGASGKQGKPKTPHPPRSNRPPGGDST